MTGVTAPQEATPGETESRSPAPSATLVRYAIDLYRLFDAKATIETINGKELRVYRGSVTDVFRELGVSNAHYSPINKLLEQTSSISLIQRGARNVPSVLVLHREPEPDDFEGLVLTSSGDAAILQLRTELSGLRESLGGQNIVELAKTIEDRFKSIEARLTKAGF